MKKHIKKLAVMVLIIIALSQPIVASAHDAFFLQSVIDENQNVYQINVIEDKASTFSNEAKHIEAELADFSHLAQFEANFSIDENGVITDNGKEVSKKYEELKQRTATGYNMMFTFPPIESRFLQKKNHATNKDAERAFLVKDYLNSSLNEALKVLNGGRAFADTEELIELSHLLCGGGSIINKYGEEFTITYETSASPDAFPVNEFGQKIKRDENHINYIEDFAQIDDDYGNTYYFVFRIAKGYNGFYDDLKTQDFYNYDNDAEYITWQHLIYQANYSYLIKGYSTKTAYDMGKPGSLEVAFVDLVSNLFNQLRNLLGLYNSHDLIFNTGTRGTNLYLYGVMPKSWSDSTMIFYRIFQAIAFLLIGFAIVKAIIQRNLSTINAAVRINLIDSIQNLLITGFILINIFPILQMFMYLNFKLVALFEVVSPNLSTLEGVNYYSSALGGIVLQFVYFIISIYLNLVYILRGLTLAMLIASAPLFVSSIAFGGKWKGLFSTWIREVLCNIFLQTFQAFIMAFFIQIQANVRGIESLIVAYALIPLTEFFKGMIMGPGGGFATAVGGQALIAGAGAVAGVMSGRTKTASNSAKSTKDREHSESKEQSMYDTTSAAGGSQKVNEKSREMQIATQEAHQSVEVPLNHTMSSFGDKAVQGESVTDVSDKSTMPEPKYVDNLKNIKGMEDIDKVKNGTFEKTITHLGQGAIGLGAGLAKGGLRTVASAGKLVAGTGLMVGLGGFSGGSQIAGRMFQSAGGDMKSAIRDVGDGFKDFSGHAGDAMKEVQAWRNDAKHDFEVAQHYGERNQDGWKPMESEMYSTLLTNGDREICRDATVLKYEGLVDANTRGKGIAMTYDMNTLSATDKGNLQQYATLYRDATKGTSGLEGEQKAEQEKIQRQKIDFLNSQGVAGISIKNNKNVVVTYNETGARKLGLKSVKTTTDGRMIETKRPDDYVKTLKTFALDDYAPRAPQSYNNRRTSNA